MAMMGQDTGSLPCFWYRELGSVSAWFAGEALLKRLVGAPEVWQDGSVSENRGAVQIQVSKDRE